MSNVRRHMKPSSLLLLFALTFSGSIPARSDDVWRSPDGTAVSDTPSRKAINGFGVSLVITADADWQAKWETPSHVTPNFTEAKSVANGGRLTILTFVVNPRPSSRQELNVSSHILVTRPNGTTSVNMPRSPCLTGKLTGAAKNVRLCEAVIQFSADPGDAPGIWKVKVTVRDENRGTEVPVEGSFELEAR
jgi:hypothetical protein